MTIRRAAARAGGLSKRGWNLDLMRALNPKNDPIKIASAPLKRYAWEWWQSSEPTPHGPRRHSDAMSAGTL
eukprot:3424361-Pyramimonas_sp.AAC.1